MKGHEYTTRKHPFFEGSPYNIRDLVIFIKYYIEGHTPKQCALATSLLPWILTALFMEHVYKPYQKLIFSFDAEIDESLFGWKIKYNKGRPDGIKSWTLA